MTSHDPRVRVYQGWLDRECQHARIEQEEIAKARKLIDKRCAAYDRAHSLGDVLPEEPEMEHPMSTRAASAHKAALEAEARVAEMREACARICDNNERGATAGTLAELIRAIPSLSPDRFMRLLKAARELEFGAYPAHGQGFVIIVTGGNIDKFKEALAAFPQPEEQP